MNDQDNISQPSQAVIYSRVACIDNLSNEKFNEQERRCREYAEQHQYEVVALFRDHASGTETDRPGMTDLLQFLQERQSVGTVVIIDDICRLARSVTAHMYLRGELEKVGAVLKSRCDFNVNSARPNNAIAGVFAPL
jgi:site-specific DNA recombinase